MHWRLIMLSFHFPEEGGAGGQLTAAAEVVGLAGDQVHRLAAPGIEVGVEGMVVGVDGHQHPLLRAGALEDQLPVGEQHVPIAAMAQGGAVPLGAGQLGDEVGELAGEADIGRASRKRH